MNTNKEISPATVVFPERFHPSNVILGDTPTAGVFVMEERKCKKCGEVKPISEFYKEGKYYRHDCKLCNNKKDKKYRKTILGLIVSIYNSQKASSKKRGHTPPEYSFGELFEWIISQSNFEDLHYNWVISNYSTDLKPSVDRLDDYKGYSFNNIRLITFRENYKKSHMDMINGINNKTNKTVLQYDLDGNLIKEYHSLHDIARNTDMSWQNIATVCRGVRTTAYGFKWIYKRIN